MIERHLHSAYKKLRRKSFFIDLLLGLVYFNKYTVFLIFMHSLFG